MQTGGHVMGGYGVGTSYGSLVENKAQLGLGRHPCVQEFRL
jgi:hypothetical protein